MRKIISLICFLFPTLVFAAQSEGGSDLRMEIRSDAPDRHIVVKGDTLWDISEKFFLDPWKWPHIWNMNQDSIKNPHWIYPGDIIILDRASGTLRVNEPIDAASGNIDAQTGSTGSDAERLEPRVRSGRSPHDAIPSIPSKLIAPFLDQPLVIENEALENAPVLIGARESRVLLGTDDTAFAKGLDAEKGNRWQIYRPSKTFVDPDTEEVLGTEAVYLGNSEVTKFGDVSTVSILFAKQEIRAGDNLAASTLDEVGAYLPRAPESNISAKIISVYGGVSQAGQNAIITLNKGARDGLEVGHVLALYHKGEEVEFEGDDYQLPDERYGLVFVFRVFNKVSYALVMHSKLPAQLLDRTVTP